MTQAILATFDVDSMVGELCHVALRRPGAILDCDHERWHRTKPIDAAAMQRQFAAFAALLEADGATIHRIESADDGLADSRLLRSRFDRAR